MPSPCCSFMHVKIEKPQGAQVKPFKQQTIMTHPVQTSIINHSRLYANHYYLNLYQAFINTEDGEVYEYEIEADTFHDATEKAEEYAFSLGVDITYIEVYHMV